MSNTETPGMGRLWWEGMRCGLRNVPHVRDRAALRHTLRLLLCPVDLWRYAEFAAVLAAYRGQSPILDIASPKLLSLVLARRFGAHVFTGDIVRQLGEEIAVYACAANRGALTPCVFDARALPFANESVPFVYSVSAVEHIGNDGDGQALREMGRVLAPGGTAVITAPAGPEFREIWLEHDPYGRQPADGDRVFFSYIYDRETLHERLVKPSGLTLETLSVWTENPPGWYETHYVPAVASGPLRAAATKARDPWLARRHITKLPDGATCTGRGVAALVLRKRGEETKKSPPI